MKTINNLWDDFNFKYSNIPVWFEEWAYWNWFTKTFQLAFYPIMEMTDYRPVVVMNTWTYAVPIWTTLTENTHYTVNFETWQIIFVTAPAEVLNWSKRTISVKITANHCKINLRYFITFYNLIIETLHLYFPKKEFRKIESSELWLTDWSSLEYIDISTAPFSDYKKILEVYQNESDEKHLVFKIRDNLLYPDITDNHTDFKNYLYWPTDYNKVPPNNTWALYTPFWLRWVIKYPKFDISLVDPNTVLNEDTELSEDTWVAEFIILRIALEMYKMRKHWSDRMNSSTLRVSTSMDLDKLIQNLSFELQRYTISFAPGTWNIPQLTKL